MKRVMLAKNKVTLLLLSAILLLCIGFIFTACGVGPATKGVNNNAGQYALDLVTNCPAGRNCTFSAEATTNAYTSINNTPLTLEAWIQPKVTSSAFILQHLEARGAGLKVVTNKLSTSCNAANPGVFTYGYIHGLQVGQALTTADTLAGCNITPGTYYVCTIPSLTTMTLDDTDASCGSLVSTIAGGGSTTDIDWGRLTLVTPSFEIRRVVASANPQGSTSSVAYNVTGTPIALNAWTHIAGVLVESPNATAKTAHALDHTNAGVACAITPGDGDATNDTWHIDMYIDGTLTACAATYGGNTDYTGGGAEVDPTAAADAYAHEPGAKLVKSYAKGIIDDTRIWLTDTRTISQCYGNELGTNPPCDRTDSDLLSYFRFNAGSGHTVMDEAGVFGSGGLEYALGNDLFQPWDDGWTSDTPF